MKSKTYSDLPTIFDLIRLTGEKYEIGLSARYVAIGDFLDANSTLIQNPNLKGGESPVKAVPYSIALVAKLSGILIHKISNPQFGSESIVSYGENDRAYSGEYESGKRSSVSILTISDQNEIIGTVYNHLAICGVFDSPIETLELKELDLETFWQGNGERYRDEKGKVKRKNNGSIPRIWKKVRGADCLNFDRRRAGKEEQLPTNLDSLFEVIDADFGNFDEVKAQKIALESRIEKAFENDKSRKRKARMKRARALVELAANHAMGLDEGYASWGQNEYLSEKFYSCDRARCDTLRNFREYLKLAN